MTEIVVANRNGLAEAPDGSKHRLVRGRTLADARHPLAHAHPDLFSPYTIDLPYDDASPAAESDASGDSAGSTDTWAAKVAEVEAVADGYRDQLASIVEVLHAHDALPAEGTTEPGWLAKAVAAALDRPAVAEDAPKAPELPAPPRTRAPRRPAAPRPAAADAQE